MSGSLRYDPLAVLPTGASINPTQLAASAFYFKEMVAYVLFKQNESRTRPTRVLTSYGSLGWKVGDVKYLQHDQTGAYLGEYMVSGIAYGDPDAGMSVGDVPSISIKHCVVK